MTIQSGPLSNLFPEIFPLIAAHLPLHATPSTLLALALTSHHISEIALPLVYSRLILKNEGDAIRILQKLLADPPFGRVVRELHIMSGLSPATVKGQTAFDVVRGVEKVVAAGCLPFIHTLGLHLMDGWYYDSDFQSIDGFGRLSPSFWADLKKDCPRLRGLVLKGFGDDPDEPWLDESGFLEAPDITSLTLRFKMFSLNERGCEKLLKHIASLAPSLHTLDLAPNSDAWISTSSIFSLDLPQLRSLSLTSFQEVNTSQAMSFWERHSQIQYLNVGSNDAKARCFAQNIPTGFLPKLKHLRAHFNDVRLLVPILCQLISLAIIGSVNAQVPYLLRSVIPNGLPNLQSLAIDQSPSASGKNVNVEGSLWYESADEKFHEVKVQKGSRKIFDNYVHSIVRGAPNLEELAFHSYSLQFADFVAIAPEFAGFATLKHLYYEGQNPNDFWDMDEEGRNDFVAQVKEFVATSKGLESITEVNVVHLPYVTARVDRTGSGEVEGVEVAKGYGMKIGYDDEAFPWAPV